jgi:hypothetical protein
MIDPGRISMGRIVSRGMGWRALISAVAGGGLTMAGLGGPLAGGALGAEAPSGSTTTGSTTTAPTETTTGTTTATTPESTTTTTPTTGAGSSTTLTSTGTSTTPATTSTPASTPAPGAPAAPTPTVAPAETGVNAPTVVVHRRQQATPGKTDSGAASTKTSSTSAGASGTANGKSKAKSTSSTGAGSASGAPNDVAAPPQLVAAQASALEALLNGTAASAQTLGFYRIPLFLLPIYQAAAVQYDVPWPILAAINEIETDYGTDLSVSSAGAEGWMQFEPSTWLMYGVDALNAGYADPYNPVDAIFAAARYLHAAGASQNLSQAILAYNHSEAYVESVLLRAKLIAAYPDQVIATLTGLVDGRPPVTGSRIAWSAPIQNAPAAPASLPSSSSATAGASAVSPSANAPGVSSPSTSAASAGATTPDATTPGSTPAPTPAAAAAATGAAGAGASAGALQLVDITSAPKAQAVAVQDGRIVKLGHSRKLGDYVVLQDIYGDLFTYAGLGGIARTYTPAASQSAANAATQGASGSSSSSSSSSASSSSSSSTTTTTTATVTAASMGAGKVRVFAHPGNPDARVAVRARAVAQRAAADGRRPLRSGSIVSEGTVLGDVSLPAGAADGHLRFAIQPAGDSSTIDPRAILANWAQLDAALHPQGARGNPSLLGATASDVFLMAKPELERTVLSDPGIALSACSRHEVASGAIDKRALAALAFLSRSGLSPTVGTLRCGAYDAAGYVQPGHAGDAVAIVAINGVPISGHQGAGTITDTTIRTLLTLQGQFAPARIVSLMRYPKAPTTFARADHGGYVEIVFAPSSTRARAARATVTAPAATAATGAQAGAAAGSATPPAPAAALDELSSTQWSELIGRIAALPAPRVSVKPSSAAIPDHPKSG